MTANYDVSAFLLAAQPNLFLTATVLRQGVELRPFEAPLQPISPPRGTATLLIEYYGDEPVTSDQIQLTLWQKTGELCPNPPVCYPV